MTNVSDTLQSIDNATLTPLVRQVLGRQTAEVVDWQAEQIHRSATAARIYRLWGTARDRDDAMPWSLVLKVIRLGAPGSFRLERADREDPSGSHYWKREAQAYRSGLLDDLPGGMAAPRCFGVAEPSNGECWIWMEDVADHFGSVDRFRSVGGIVGKDAGAKWPFEHYAVVAHHLGQFNGAYLAGRPIPSHDWLSTGWLRAWVANTAPYVPRLRDFLVHPLVRRAYPDDAAEEVLRLWEEHETLLDALDRLPQTFCHMDAFRRNLIAQRDAEGRGRTVAIDWAYSGTEAVGVEIHPLIAAGLGLEVPMDRAEELEAMVLDAYLRGLRDAGWEGDERSVRFGYSVASAMRYPFIGVQLWLSMARHEGSRARWERAVGMPVEELADLWGAAYRFQLARADTARELLGKM